MLDPKKLKKQAETVKEKNRASAAEFSRREREKLIAAAKVKADEYRPKIEAGIKAAAKKGEFAYCYSESSGFYYDDEKALVQAFRDLAWEFREQGFNTNYSDSPGNGEGPDLHFLTIRWDD